MTNLPDAGRFAHITDWVFDLDNTLYPHHSNLFSQIDVKMTAYVSELLRLPREEARKLQKELQKEVITAEAGDGAVRVEINGEMKIKKVHIDADSVDLDDIGQLERWVEEAVKAAINDSQKLAADKMQPMMGSLGNLGL